MIDDAYIDRKYDEVMSDTWGHMKPENGRVYSGYILYTVSECGDLVVIKSAFMDLDGGPWLYQDIQDFIGLYIDVLSTMSDQSDGRIWMFRGTYRIDRRIKFRGTIVEIDVDAMMQNYSLWKPAGIANQICPKCGRLISEDHSCEEVT